MKNILFLLALLTSFLANPSTSIAQAPTDKQLQAIEKYMAPLRKKVTDILEADKTGQYKTYKADLATIAKENDPSRKEALFAKLDRDHYAFIKKNYDRAVINHEEMRLEISRILGHNNFTLGEFADIHIEFTPPKLALPERFDATLNCPFSAKDESDNNSGASQCDSEVFDCGIAVESLAEIAGGCRSKGDLGDTFELPEGTFTNIKVVVQSDISWRGWAMAIGGYAQINAKFGIRFRAPGLDKTVMAKEVFTFAPVVWYSHTSGNVENFIVQASFTGTFNGGSVVKAQTHVEVFALSVPLLTLTEMDANAINVDSIRLDGSN
ncbi:MAG: hypothetical protein H7246_14455 [Phycisphaerae bacterium]|nr:hypothetical protein [Saprospiraceae bacterium]